MKRLTLIVLLLSVCQLAIAQHLERYTGENLNYQLKWSLLGFGLFSSKAGEASLWCQATSDGGWQLTFHGYSTGLAKIFYNVDDRAWVKLDSQARVQEITHLIKGKKKKQWLVDRQQQRVYFFLSDSLMDSLSITTQEPGDALSSIYLLRGKELFPEYQEKFCIVGRDSSGQSVWKPVAVKVIGQEKISVIDQSINCWILQIQIDPEDNLFPGGQIKLWVTADKQLIPVKVKSDLYLAGLVPSQIEGVLVSKQKKDD